MKLKTIIILLLFASCGQGQKENKKSKIETVIKKTEATEKSIDTSKTTLDLSFDKVINEIKSKALPLTDSTNFDSFIDEDDYDKVNVRALKLERLYPEFYKEGYNYKAIFNYKLELSERFHSVVVTVLKGDNEMESTLITYDLNGEIIDSKLISYDEIAEGMSQVQSKIEHNRITTNNIFWADEKQVETKSFTIEASGKFMPIDQEETLVNSVLNQLNLEVSKVKTDLIVTKVAPNNPKETIVVIPEIDYEEDEYYFELNSHIVIVSSDSQQIIHKYFESSKTNGWISDALILWEIIIDTAPYLISESSRAFGIRVRHANMSRPNPYEVETLSLFTKSGNSLKNILKNYELKGSVGDWDTICTGNFSSNQSTLIISEKKTNGYFNINVESEYSERIKYEDENGDCLSNDTVTMVSEVLQFNGDVYEKKTNEISVKELMLLTKEKAVEKFGAPATYTQFNLNDAQGEFRNGITDKFTKEERQSTYTFIDEVTWEKDKNSWVTVWYKVNKDKSIPKEVLVWKKGTEFLGK